MGSVSININELCVSPYHVFRFNILTTSRLRQRDVCRYIKCIFLVFGVTYLHKKKLFLSHTRLIKTLFVIMEVLMYMYIHMSGSYILLQIYKYSIIYMRVVMTIQWCKV